jgi:hypothetical protein
VLLAGWSSHNASKAWQGHHPPSIRQNLRRSQRLKVRYEDSGFTSASLARVNPFDDGSMLPVYSYIKLLSFCMIAQMTNSHHRIRTSFAHLLPSPNSGLGLPRHHLRYSVLALDQGLFRNLSLPIKLAAAPNDLADDKPCPRR